MKINKTTDFVETVVGDEIVLMHTGDGRFFSLTGTARRAWELIETCPDRDALVAALLAEYDADAAEIAGDVDALLARLAQRSLVEMAD
ncbi:MAG: PqqD family protein [Sphingopyxis sp.]|uniref:PqqD family protein n=1 Tax=Sphingopyxis sp. TaxID=1908224 RepID=UPI003D81134F